MNSFTEPFHSWTIIWNIEFLNFLDNMIRSWVIGTFIAVKNMSENKNKNNLLENKDLNQMFIKKSHKFK